MIGFGSATRVYLAAGATDMRKGFDGLYGMVRDRLRIDPLSGHLFVFCNGRRNRRFPLYTPNKAAAATRARDIYLFLLANGWEPALAKYRKPKAVLHEHSGDQPITVGIFLEAVIRCLHKSRDRRRLRNGFPENRR